MDKLIPSMACPIGMECLIGGNVVLTRLADGGWCSNADYCSYLAAPWLLPYSYDFWENPGVLHVNIPYYYDDYDGDESMAEHEIIAQEESNQRVAQIRREYKAAGWCEAEWLPYFYDFDQKAMIVWDILEKYDFLPAVPLSKQPRYVCGENKFEEYGFYLYGIDIEWSERWEWCSATRAFCNDALGECFYFENERQPLNRATKTCKQLIG